VVEPNATLVFDGLPPNDRVTGVEKLPNDVTVAMNVAVPPGATILEDAETGASVTLKSGAPVMDMTAVPVCVMPPPTAVTVNVVLPVPVNLVNAGWLLSFASLLPAISSAAATSAVVVIANEAVSPEAVAVCSPKVAVAPVGRPDAVSVIGELNPPVSVILTV
jgi:hypothetical protein